MDNEVSFGWISGIARRAQFNRIAHISEGMALITILNESEHQITRKIKTHIKYPFRAP